MSLVVVAAKAGEMGQPAVAVAAMHQLVQADNQDQTTVLS
jgi:hypothetical protein